MTTLTKPFDVGGLLPGDYAPLIVQPVMDASVGIQASTVVTTSSNAFHVPVITDDVTAAWLAEGAEITPDDATFAELVVTPSKVAALTIISRELAEDSSPAAAGIIGKSMARDIARKVDAAFFGAASAPAPSGLGALAGTTSVDGGSVWANLDAFAEAISAAEGEGATLGSFVANPADALILAQLKAATGSNLPLLATDPTVATRRLVAGVPLLVSTAVTAGTIWGIPKAAALVVLRTDVWLETSKDAYFSSDRVGVRGTMRVGFGFPHPAAIIEIALTP